MVQVIDKKLFAAIEKLNTTQKKAVLDFVDNLQPEHPDLENKWETDQFVSEMEMRYDEYKNEGQSIPSSIVNTKISEIIKNGKR